MQISGRLSRSGEMLIPSGKHLSSMTDFRKPQPIVDSREETLFSELTDKYKEFQSPGLITRQASRAKREVAEAGRRAVGWIPGVDKPEEGDLKNHLTKASKKKHVKQALATAAKGGGKAFQWCAQGTLSRKSILSRLQKSGVEAESFEHICAKRSYDIAGLAESDWKDRLGAATQGFLTGAKGGVTGVAANLALAAVLFHRATQRVALHFGYDAIRQESEQVIAGEVMLKCLQSSGNPTSGKTSDVFKKVVLASEISALKEALRKKSFEQMAKAGGLQLLYAKTRATANKAAKKGLKKAGKEGFETALVRRLLKDLGKKLPKRAGRRIVPIVGGVIGGLFDTWQMHQVIRGASLFYHKRFIAEKEERVRRLGGDDEAAPMIEPA